MEENIATHGSDDELSIQNILFLKYNSTVKSNKTAKDLTLLAGQPSE